MDIVSNGICLLLNAPEEVWLAEKLIEINPWAAEALPLLGQGGEARN